MNFIISCIVMKFQINLHILNHLIISFLMALIFVGNRSSIIIKYGSNLKKGPIILMLSLKYI